MKKRTMALLAAVLLIIGGVIGGTLAWLTAQSAPVVNTFTTSDINITLGESTKEYKMIPGWSIDKDPKVTVIGGSEDCYLFVKLDKSANYDSYMEEYVLAEGWQTLNKTEYPGVYYREVTANAADQEFYVLKDNKVFVKGEVTKEGMKNAENNEPTLTVTAYASQLYRTNTEKFAPTEAWTNIK